MSDAESKNGESNEERGPNGHHREGGGYDLLESHIKFISELGKLGVDGYKSPYLEVKFAQVPMIPTSPTQDPVIPFVDEDEDESQFLYAVPRPEARTV